MITGAQHVKDELHGHMRKRNRTLLTRLRTRGCTPELAWFREFLERRNQHPESAICPHCNEETETVEHLMEKCPAHENLNRKTVSRRGRCDEKLVREAGIGNVLRLPGYETTWRRMSRGLEAFGKEKNI